MHVNLPLVMSNFPIALWFIHWYIANNGIWLPLCQSNKPRRLVWNHTLPSHNKCDIIKTIMAMLKWCSCTAGIESLNIENNYVYNRTLSLTIHNFSSKSKQSRSSVSYFAYYSKINMIALCTCAPKQPVTQSLSTILTQQLFTSGLEVTPLWQFQFSPNGSF